MSAFEFNMQLPLINNALYTHIYCIYKKIKDPMFKSVILPRKNITIFIQVQLNLHFVPLVPFSDAL